METLTISFWLICFEIFDLIHVFLDVTQEEANHGPACAGRARSERSRIWRSPITSQKILIDNIPLIFHII